MHIYIYIHYFKKGKTKNRHELYSGVSKTGFISVYVQAGHPTSPRLGPEDATISGIIAGDYAAGQDLGHFFGCRMGNIAFVVGELCHLYLVGGLVAIFYFPIYWE